MADMQTSYEELPYSRTPFAATHPDTLATVALLHGLAAPPIKSCRVLELGCALGGNLVPMAAGLPEARFVGIDLSPRQIATAQELVDAVGLKNVELRALDILDVDRRFGTFDYILCHGVYAWVPSAVQDKIMRICGELLARNGVAYISYNTYPGFHIRAMVREMLAYHVARSGETQPQAQVRQGRGFLDFLNRFVRNPEGTYGLCLKEEIATLDDESDTYLFHEHLEEINSPLYFHEFAARAAAHGLQYLAEAQPWAVLAELPAPARQVLDHVAADRIAREQYLDFLGGRLFRRSLLCRAGSAVKSEPAAEVLRCLRATSLVRPTNAEPDLRSDAVEEFCTAKNVRLSTNSPPVKTMLTTLYRAWPRSLPVERLVASVREQLVGSGLPESEQSSERLTNALLHCYRARLVELHTFEPSFVLEISDRPLACPVARALVGSEKLVPNRRHCSVPLEELDRLLLPSLDGKHDQAALRQVLRDAVREGRLEREEGQPIPEGEALETLLTDTLEASLRRLAGSALLVY
jgi:SAM-dependent methyltransferase/methyltransferase-like protein